ncbi:hypothetical protein DFH11DRAFT_536614 [Phellopilus nigrolimitatus]|nr:hypothetical protein DFH11DRAFT_536614 [Phellopilus nigrolimitatus]
MDQASEHESGSSSSSKTMSDEVRFLDYLSTDFSYLRRFVLGSHQMVRLLKSEGAKSEKEMQEKLVINIEIAKETLSEAGASARPFVPCPPHLELHRQAYFDMLVAARALVPHVLDADVKLRLRRLLLPLTSMSHFRVALPKEASLPLPKWSNKPGFDSVTSTSSPAAALGNEVPPTLSSRKKTRRSSAATPLRFSSASSVSTDVSRSYIPPRQRPFATASGSGRKTSRASPYPLPVPRPNAGADSLRPDAVSKQTSTTGTSSPGTPDMSVVSVPQPQSSPPSSSTSTPSASQPSHPSPSYQTTEHQPQYQHLRQSPSLYTKSSLTYHDPQTPQRNIGTVNTALQKNPSSVSTSTPQNWDWSRNRQSLAGLDSNLSNSQSVIVTDISPTWSCWTLKNSSTPPSPSPGLIWCKSWDEAGPRKGPIGPMAAETFGFVADQPTGEKSLADSTCVGECPFSSSVYCHRGRLTPCSYVKSVCARRCEASVIFMPNDFRCLFLFRAHIVISPLSVCRYR